MVNNYKKKNKNKKKRHQRAQNLKPGNEHTEDKQEQLDDQEDESDTHDEPTIKISDSTKRQHEDDDSDVEEKPKRKKKKKQPIATESTDKKGKKSIRQMKKEKFAERQAEAQAASKDHLKGQCLNYLSQWKHDKQNWKFMKAKQVWLYKNKFSSYLLPDSSWPLLLEYFESAQGNIRTMLLNDANKVIKQMDEWTESGEKTKDKDAEEEEDNNEDSDAASKAKPDENVYKRARDLIQCLEE